MDRFDDDTLLAELREIRPASRPEFTAELDERAAAGFPRRDSRAGANPFARLAERVRDRSGRRLLVPAVGLTIAVLAVAVVVVAVGSNGGSGGNLMTSATSESTGGGGAEMSEGASEESAGAEAHATAPAKPHAQSKAREGGFNGKFFEESGKSGAEEAEGTVHAGEEAVESEPAEEAAEAEEEVGGVVGAAPSFNAGGGNAGAARGHRDVERSASIVLGTKPGEVAAAAAKVYAAVHAANGVVLNSSVESGSTGDTGASFSLLIPSGKVDDALAAFSRIAEVRSRHDATQDITKPTVGVTEELRDSNASIEGLLKGSAMSKRKPNGNRSKRGCAKSAATTRRSAPRSNTCTSAPRCRKCV